MKPGDKVWFIVCREHAVLKIISGEISFVQSEYVRVNGEPRCVIVKNEFGIPHWKVPYDSVFPTREALCEYYRKIFE